MSYLKHDLAALGKTKFADAKRWNAISCAGEVALLVGDPEQSPDADAIRKAIADAGFLFNAQHTLPADDRARTGPGDRHPSWNSVAHRPPSSSARPSRRGPRPTRTRVSLR